MRDLLKNPFVKFLSIFSILVVLWFSFYYNIYNIDALFSSGNIDIQKSTSISLAQYANFFTGIFGYTPTLDTSTNYVVTAVDGSYYNHGVWIGEPCNGIKVFGLFSIFIIAFPGNWKNKLWFIPSGIFVLHTANAIRISILTILAAENPAILNFNHNITFQVIMYGIIFVFWYWWVQKFSGISIKKKHTNE